MAEETGGAPAPPHPAAAAPGSGRGPASPSPAGPIWPPLRLPAPAPNDAGMEEDGGAPPPTSSAAAAPQNGCAAVYSSILLRAAAYASGSLPPPGPREPGLTLGSANPSSSRGVEGSSSQPALGISVQGELLCEDYWLELDGQNQLPAIANEVGMQSVAQIVDWDSLQIGEPDEEGRLQVVSDDKMYEVLGLKGEDERAAAANGRARNVPNIDVGLDGADIVVDDLIPDERVIVYDPDNPEMYLGALFPSTYDFKIAVRQYAMDKEFELDVRRSGKERYDGYCLADDDCTWHIHGRTERPSGRTIIVTAYKDGHTCTSSSRRLTTTPSAKWVASKAVMILKKTPQMRVVDMQRKLRMITSVSLVTTPFGGEFKRL